MGQALLWIELLVASCLLVAIATIAAARSKRPSLRRLITLIELIAPLTCWVGITWLAWPHSLERIGPIARSLFLAVLTVTFVVAALIILRRGLKDHNAANWSAWKLNIVFGAACVLSLITFWNLDLNARNRLGRLRARANSIVATTFPPRIPDTMNAARMYEQAFKSFNLTTGGNIIDWPAPVERWLDAEQTGKPQPGALEAEVRNILKAYSKGLNQLRRATTMEQCRFVDYWDSEDLVSTLMPQLSNMRTAASLLAADARIRASDGDIAGAIADVNALFAMAEHATREPTMLSALASISIEARSVDTMEAVLAGCAPQSAEPLNLKIAPLFSHVRMVRAALRGEEALGLSILASWGDTDNPNIPARYFPAVTIPLRRVFLLQDDIRGYETAVHEWQRLASMPYHQAREDWKTLPSRLMRKQIGFLTASVLPAVSAYPKKAAEGDAKHRLARLAAAVTAYRIKTGELPDNLDKITPAFIEKIPSDPYDGKPLRMSRNASGGATLYSIGPDVKDNGGEPLNNGKGTGDIVFRLAAKK